MAKVPRTPLPQVQDAPMPGIRVPNVDVSRSYRVVGRTITQAADRYAFAKDRADRTRARSKMNVLLDRYGEILRTGKDPLLETRGEHAFGSQEKGASLFDEIESEIEGDLSSDQLSYFREMKGPARRRAEGMLAQHENNQFHVVRDSANKGMLARLTVVSDADTESFAQMAIVAPGDTPAEVKAREGALAQQQATFSAVEAHIKSFFAEEGLSEEAAEMEFDKWRKKQHAKTIAALLTPQVDPETGTEMDVDYDRAAEYYTLYSSQMDADTRRDATSKIGAGRKIQARYTTARELYDDYPDDQVAALNAVNARKDLTEEQKADAYAQYKVSYNARKDGIRDNRMASDREILERFADSGFDPKNLTKEDRVALSADALATALTWQERYGSQGPKQAIDASSLRELQGYFALDPDKRLEVDIFRDVLPYVAHGASATKIVNDYVRLQHAGETPQLDALKGKSKPFERPGGGVSSAKRLRNVVMSRAFDGKKPKGGSPEEADLVQMEAVFDDHMRDNYMPNPPEDSASKGQPYKNLDDVPLREMQREFDKVMTDRVMEDTFGFSNKIHFLRSLDQGEILTMNLIPEGTQIEGYNPEGEEYKKFAADVRKPDNADVWPISMVNEMQGQPDEMEVLRLFLMIRHGSAGPKLQGIYEAAYGIASEERKAVVADAGKRGTLNPTELHAALNPSEAEREIVLPYHYEAAEREAAQYIAPEFRDESGRVDAQKIEAVAPGKYAEFHESFIEPIAVGLAMVEADADGARTRLAAVREGLGGYVTRETRRLAADAGGAFDQEALAAARPGERLRMAEEHGWTDRAAALKREYAEKEAALLAALKTNPMEATIGLKNFYEMWNRPDLAREYAQRMVKEGWTDE